MLSLNDYNSVCEIKTIFFILMVVGYVISTLYKKESQKEKERRINKRPVNPRTSEEIFKELQKTINQRPNAEPAKVPVPKTKSEPVPKMSKKKLETTLKNEVVRMSSQKVKAKHPNINAQVKYKSQPMKETEQVAEEKTSYRPDFDLRKAVLYSEILKRPQY